MDAIARKTGAFINAVMLGIIAGSGRLPIPVEAFEAAIRADGKGVDGNLRGFRAGLRGGAERRRRAARGRQQRPRRRRPSFDARDRRDSRKRARDIIREGVRRLAAYQDMAYARLYLDRLAPIRDADARAKCRRQACSRETARHLAVRMSYEDVIRVAQAKTDPARFARIAAEVGAKPGEPVKVVRIPQARHRGIVLGAAAVAGAPHPRVRRAPREARALPLGHGGQHHVGLAAICASGCSQSCSAGGRAPIAMPRSSATIERWLGLIVEAASAVRRARARDRRMRAPDQGLWRHPSSAAPATTA